MSVKLQNGSYRNRQDFEADFRLMIKNCKTYNSEGTFAHGEAVGLGAYFEKGWLSELRGMKVLLRRFIVWAKINATVASAEKAAPRSEPVPVSAPMVASPEPIEILATQPAAPKLKIKLGSGQAAAEPVTNTEKVPKVPKAKASKPRLSSKARATDMPPPPYIDDGSHDLLQEVIAMEELSNQTPKKEPKHRRAVELDPEDELLILASPSRDEDSAIEPKPQEQIIAPPAPVSIVPAKPTPAPTSLRINKSVERVKPIIDKGKEKDRTQISASMPAPIPVVAPQKRKTPPTAQVRASGQISTPVNEIRVRDVLKVLMNMPQSIIFNQPVDPIRDGCPT